MITNNIIKMNLIKYINNTSLESISCTHSLSLINKGKDKYTSEDLIDYLNGFLKKKFNVDPKDIYLRCSMQNIEKIVFLLDKALYSCVKNNVSLNEALMADMMLLEERYISYVDNIEEESNEGITRKFNDMKKFLSELSKENNLDNNYTEMIADFEKRIKELELELKDKITSVCVLEKENNSLNKKYNHSEKDRKKYEDKVFALQGRLDELISEFTGIKQAFCSGESSLDESLQEKIKGLDFKDRIEVLFNSFNEIIQNYELVINDLKKKINTLEWEKEKELKKEAYFSKLVEKNEIIKDNIITLLNGKSLTIVDIQKELEEQGFSVSREDLYELLKEINSRISILDKKFFGGEPHYSIFSPKVDTNVVLDVEVNGDKNYKDLLVISDLHLSSISDEYKKILDVTYDYAAGKGMDLILNTGDFFGITRANRKDIDLNFQIFDSVLNDFSSRTGIYHALLGGNHDQFLLRYGFDPIKVLAENREEFISLGYNQAFVRFNNKNKIGLHHPIQKHPGFLSSYNVNHNGIVDNLIEHYNEAGLSRKDSYFDILGHFHLSTFDYYNSFCTVPSYSFDRATNGAWRIRIYFDENKKIDYMILLPLTVGREVKEVSEIVYKKMLLK